MVSRLRLAAALLALATLPPPAHAKGPGALAFDSENDIYGAHGDRYYTNGLRLAYVSAATEATSSDRRWFAGVAQEIYSPHDRYATNPPRDDHPYSAYLHATVGMIFSDTRSLDLLTLDAGVVGSWALGEQAQNNWHHAIGIRPLNGWDTQLHNEPGLDLAWLRVWKIRVAGADRGWAAELLPRFGVEAGTVRDVAKAGAQFRFGKNLPDDFGELRMRDGLTGATPVRYDRPAKAGWAPDAWYLFVDAQAEAWAYNMPLDGNLFHDSRSVDSETRVGQFSAGLAAHWGSARVAFSQIARTREFRTQRDVPHTFGALTVTVTR